MILIWFCRYPTVSAKKNASSIRRSRSGTPVPDVLPETETEGHTVACLHHIIDQLPHHRLVVPLLFIIIIVVIVIPRTSAVNHTLPVVSRTDLSAPMPQQNHSQCD